MRQRLKRTSNKLAASVAAVVLLAVCLCITTFALVYAMVSVDNNLFQMGEVRINLNDGEPVITEEEFLFEPGMTVEKRFFLENESTWDVYYRLYFENVEGGLSGLLDVTIRNGDTVLYHGKAQDLTQEKTGAVDDVLRLHERRDLTVSFHFPEEAGNSAQNLYLAFDLKAEAVQTKNNPDRLFE